MNSQSMHSPVTGPEPMPSRERDSSHDTGAPLSELADELLRCAVRARERGGDRGAAADSEMREVLQRACAAAHERGLHAEELVIVLRARWRYLPEAGRLVRNDGEALCARVITLCIREFYSPGCG